MAMENNTVDINIEVRVGRNYDIDIDGVSLDGITQEETQSFEQHILDAFDSVMENHDMGAYVELDEIVSVDIEGIFQDLEFKRYPKSHHEETESIYATLSIPPSLPLTKSMLDEIASEITDFTDFGIHADWEKPQIEIPKDAYPNLLAGALDKVKEVYEDYYGIFTPYQMSAKLFEELKSTPFNLPQSIESSFENILENSPIHSIHNNIVYKIAETTMETMVEQQALDYDRQQNPPEPSVHSPNYTLSSPSI